MSQFADRSATFDYPILICDIGGTYARFALITDAFADVSEFPVVRCADFPTIKDAIQSVLDQTYVSPRSVILAVAAPVDGEVIPFTNNHWVVEPIKLIEEFKFTDVTVLNDFEAQALAAVALGEEHLERIGGGVAETTGPRVVIGPGTGLGVAGLVYAKRTWIPLGGEGGHVDIGPRNAFEFEVFKHIVPEGERVSAEHILCGRGIINLYRAVCLAEGVEADMRTAEDITATGMRGDDDRTARTLDLFITLLGRFAGDMALVHLSKGGVYLTGGMLQDLVSVLKDGRFRRAFDAKGPHEALMARIPIYLMVHPLASIIGLAAFSRTPSRFGIETTGRRWRG